MMNQQLEATLAECLVALEDHTLEEVLAMIPDDAAKLAPYLRTAVALQTLLPVRAAVGEDESLGAMLDYAGSVKRTAKRPARRSGFAFPWVRAFAILVLVLLATLVLAERTQAALPGMPLYGLKRDWEAVRLSLASQPDQQARLTLEIEAERRREVLALLDSGREAGTTFTGTLESMTASSWNISGVQVYLTDSAQIRGEPVPGSRVEVHGGTVDGRFIASVLVVDGVSDGDDMVTQPAPTATAILPTPTAQTSATPHATQTPSSEPDDSDHTPVPPTATLTPAGTTPDADPTDSGDGDGDDDGGDGDDNENDNDDDGDDDNENDNDDEEENDNGDDGGDD